MERCCDYLGHPDERRPPVRYPSDRDARARCSADRSWIDSDRRGLQLKQEGVDRVTEVLSRGDRFGEARPSEEGPFHRQEGSGRGESPWDPAAAGGIGDRLDARRTTV